VQTLNYFLCPQSQLKKEGIKMYEKTIVEYLVVIMCSIFLIDIIFLRPTMPVPPNKLVWVMAVFVVFKCADYFLDFRNLKERTGKVVE
jgi:hypothetical protein